MPPKLTLPDRIRSELSLILMSFPGTARHMLQSFPPDRRDLPEGDAAIIHRDALRPPDTKTIFGQSFNHAFQQSLVLETSTTQDHLFNMIARGYRCDDLD